MVLCKHTWTLSHYRTRHMCCVVVVIEDEGNNSTSILSAASDAGHRIVITHTEFRFNFYCHSCVFASSMLKVWAKDAAFTCPPHVHGFRPMTGLVAVNCSVVWTTVLVTASSSDSSSKVTLSWKNDRETTSSTSGWTNTTPAVADKSTSFEDDNATTAMLTTSAPSLMSFWQIHEMMKWLEVAPPILIVLATVGNTLSLITLQNPTLHHELHV